MADISLIIDVESKEVSRAVDELVRMRTAAKDTGKAFEQGFKKIISWQERFRGEQGRVNATLEKNFLAQQKANKSAKDSAMVFQKQEADLKKIALANRRLRMEYKEGYAAKVQLRASQMRLNRARTQGIITDEGYKKGLDRLTMAQNASTVATSNTRRAMGHSSVITQQAGYQIGDFLVQVQSGTNAMVAFGQQATQVAGTLTILGGKWVLIGSALGILIPLTTALAAAFMRTRKSTEDTSDGVETLEDKLKSLDGTLKDWIRTKRNAELGLTMDEILGGEGLDEALDTLEKARARLAEATRNAGNIIVGTTVMESPDLERLKAEKQQADAMRDIELARLRITRIQNKLAEERLITQNDELTNLREQQRLLQVRIQYGSDSVQYARAEVQIRQEAFARQVAQLDLTEKQVLELIKVNNELTDAEQSQTELENNQKAIAESTQFLNTLWTNLKNTISEAADEGARVSENLVLGQGYLDNANRARIEAGVASGALPPQALQDLPQTDAEKSLERLLEIRRRASKTTSGTTSGGGGGSSRSSTQSYGPMQDAQIQDYLKMLEEAKQKTSDLAESMAQTFGDGFTAMVEGTMSVKDAFKSMAKDIIKQLWDVLVMQKLIGSVGVGGGVGATGVAGFIGGLLGFDGGGYTGSGARSGGMDGKGGFVAMLHPQETVVDHTKGQSSGGTTVQQTLNFNFSANGDDSVKKIIAQAAPQIAQMTQKSMMDQRRRGGSMKSTFG